MKRVASGARYSILYEPVNQQHQKISFCCEESRIWMLPLSIRLYVRPSMYYNSEKVADVLLNLFELLGT